MRTGPRSSAASRSRGQRAIRALIGETEIVVLDPYTPHLDPLLEPLLGHRTWKFVPDGGGSVCREGWWLQAYDYDYRGRLAFPVGLLPRVRSALEGAGYCVDVVDFRAPRPGLQPDTGVAGRCDDDEKRLLAAVERESGGQLEAGTPEAVVKSIVLFARAYPHANIAVGVATRRAAWALRLALADELKGPVGLALSGTRRRWRRVVVGTYGGIPRDRPGGWDVILLPDAEISTGGVAVDLVVRSYARRVYAFIHPLRRADPLTRFRLEQMSGPVIHRVAAPRAGPRRHAAGDDLPIRRHHGARTPTGALLAQRGPQPGHRLRRRRVRLPGLALAPPRGGPDAE